MQSYRHHFKTNFHLAYPVMLSQLGHMLVGTADSIMVGQLGTTQLAAVSLGNVLFHVLLTFGLGISYGSTPLVAAADGEGDTSRVGSILKHSFLINMVTAVLLYLIVLASSGALYHMNQPLDVVELAIPYLGIITFSMIPLMVFQTFRQFLEGVSLTKPAMWISFAANGVNVLLNYIFIFGKWGVEPMGLNGAGWASLISRVFMAALIILYVAKGRRFANYRWNFWKSTWEKFRFNRILKIGVPAAFQYIIEVGAFGMAVIMMGWLGENYQAAHQIAINLAAISYMMASGLAAAATIRVGNQLGRKDIFTMHRAVKSLTAMVVIFMAVAAIVFVFANEFLADIYSNDPVVIEIAATLLLMAAVFQISDGIQVVSIGALRGLEDTLIPTFYIFIAYMILGLPIGYFLGFIAEMGAIGIWIGLSIGLTIVAITLQFRFYGLTSRLKNKFHSHEI